MSVVLCSHWTDPTFNEWVHVDRILKMNMDDQIRRDWDNIGYEGIAKYVKHFGMKRIYRNKLSFVCFEFDSEIDYSHFLLKWS